MEYLLIEKKAWLEMQAEAKRLNERMKKTEQYFFPGRGFGMNRQCRGLPVTEYFQTNPAILPQQRDSALYHNKEQMLL